MTTEAFSNSSSLQLSTDQAEMQGSAITYINNKDKLVVVIPALNEANGIGPILDDINNALRSYDHSVVVVDGKSTDDTAEIAKAKKAILISQTKTGYGDALKTGFIYASKILKADVVVMIDADRTYSPYDIPDIFEPILHDDSDVVLGNRFSKMDDGSMTFVNFVGNKIITFIVRLLFGIHVGDTQCGLRAARTNYFDEMRIESDGMPFATEMLIELKKAGARISETQVSYHPREGRTKLSPFRDGFNILRLILSKTSLLGPATVEN